MKADGFGFITEDLPSEDVLDVDVIVKMIDAYAR